MDNGLDMIDWARAVEALRQQILDQGIARVRFSDDAEALAKGEAQAGKKAVGEYFRSTINTLPAARVLWIGAYDDQNTCVATCAARYDELGAWTLQRFLQAFWQQAFPGEGGKPSELEPNSCAYASRWSGNAVYIGEGAVAKPHRNKNLLALIQRMLILHAWNLKKPDLIYGFMRPDMVDKGYDINWGYTIRIRDAVTWINPPAQADLRDLVFVGLQEEGIRRLISQSILEGRPMAQTNSTPSTEPPEPSAAQQ